MPPPLLPAAYLALHCWHWLGGWHPERLALYATWHELPDPDLTLALLHLLRDPDRLLDDACPTKPR